MKQRLLLKCRQVSISIKKWVSTRKQTISKKNSLKSKRELNIKHFPSVIAIIIVVIIIIIELSKTDLGSIPRFRTCFCFVNLILSSLRLVLPLPSGSLELSSQSFALPPEKLEWFCKRNCVDSKHLRKRKKGINCSKDWLLDNIPLPNCTTR